MHMLAERHMDGREADRGGNSSMLSAPLHRHSTEPLGHQAGGTHSATPLPGEHPPSWSSTVVAATPGAAAGSSWRAVPAAYAVSCPHPTAGQAVGQPAAGVSTGSSRSASAFGLAPRGTVEWRREVYAGGLWAQPMGVGGAAGRGGRDRAGQWALQSLPQQQASLKYVPPWVERELRALLLEQVQGEVSEAESCKPARCQALA